MLTALITGASSGIGLELARLMAVDHHRLILTGRNREALEKAAEECRALTPNAVEVMVEDLAEAAGPQRLFDALAARQIEVDILVNNAGFGTHGEFAYTEAADSLALLQVNVVALTHLTRLLLPGMVRRRNGYVMNVASTAAFLPGPLMACYYASKAYVLSFSEAIDAELRGSGVSVTALCPGPTATDFARRAKIENSAIFQGNTMTAGAVAQIGYRGMRKRKRLVIAGTMNRLLTLAVRLVPRRLVTSIARKLNGTR